MSSTVNNGTSSLPRWRSTPWWFFCLAIVAAVGVGVAVTSLKIFALLCIGVGAVYVLARSFRDPWFAMTCATAMYPLMAVARPLNTAYNWPVFTSGVRTFPELFQSIILMHLIIRAIKYRGTPAARFSIMGDDLPVGIYMVAALYSFVIGWINVHPLSPINGWFVSITPAVWYLLIRWLRPTKEQIRRQIGVIIAVYVALAIPSLIDYVVRPEFTMRLMDAERPFFVPSGMEPFAFWRIYPRMQSFLFEENVFGTMSELVAILCAAQLIQKRPRRSLYALFGLSLLCLALTMSRGALISLVIAFSVMLLIHGRHRPRLLSGIAVVGILGGIVLFLLPSTSSILPSIVGRLDTISLKAAERGEVANDRTHQWVKAWKIFQGQPSGMGLGTVGYAAHLSGMSEHVVGDGIYFRVLAEQGVPGILAFVFTLLGIGWTLWRYLPICDEETRSLCIAMLAFHVGFCIHSIGANTFDLYYLAPMYWMLIGLCISRIHIRRAELQNISRILSHKTPEELKRIAPRSM